MSLKATFGHSDTGRRVREMGPFQDLLHQTKDLSEPSGSKGPSDLEVRGFYEVFQELALAAVAVAVEAKEVHLVEVVVRPRLPAPLFWPSI